MRKNKKKMRATIIAAIAVVTITGLAITGKMTNWGPFSGLHSWQEDVDKIKSRYSIEKKGEIIFYGASNFALWEQMEEDMSDYKVQNHAFGGSTDADLIQYADQILYPYKPKVVFLQTGSNDYVNLSGADEDKIAECIKNKKKMFTEFHERLPDTHLVIMSGLLLPGRSEYLDMTLKINEELERYAETKDYLHFVNANDLTYNGEKLDESLFVKDKIHLNHNGQKKWYENYIQPKIEQLIEEQQLGRLRKNQ